MKLGILGCGFSGIEIGKKFVANNNNVWGTTRSTDKFPRLTNAGIEPVSFDGLAANDKVA